MKQYDCKPTLNDNEVLEFCKNGFSMFEGVISDEVNRRTIDFLDEHPGTEPVELLEEDWFIESVIKNPEVSAGYQDIRYFYHDGDHIRTLYNVGWVLKLGPGYISAA